MTVHDLVIANASGAAVRTDLNAALAAIGSNSSNSSAITGANSYPYQWQVRTDVNKLYMRDASTNTTWHEVGDVGVANLGLAKLASPTFTGVVEIANGTNGAPSIAFDSDTDTGLYRSGSNVLGISASGTASHLFKSTASEPQVPLRGTNGSQSAPSLSFAADSDTGFYRSNPDTLVATTGGAERAWFDNTGFHIKDQKSLILNDADNSHHVGIRCRSSLSSNYTLTLPLNTGTNGQFLKTNGSGTLEWGSVAATTLNAKGFIAFNGGNGSQIRANGLTVSRTGTGTYTVTINSGIRTGNSSYCVIIGNIDESGSRGVGDITNIDAVAYSDNFRVCFVSSRSTNSFTIRAYRFDPDKVGDIADDKKLYGFRRVAQDPDYISVAFFS